MTNEKTTFIFVAGALHTAWSWHRVVPLIEARGMIALTPDLPGMGENRSIAPGDATLALWGDYLANLVRAADAPVILVGHSRGGLVIGEAAERVPDRIAGLIYVSGLIIPPGRTALDVMGSGDAQRGPSPTEDGKAVQISAEAAVPLFYNRCSQADAAQAVNHLCLEPVAPNMTPATVTADRWFRVPRGYVETSDDRTLDIAKQRAMQATAPCDPVRTLDADHSPLLSAAPQLADALLEIAAHFIAGCPSGPSHPAIRPDWPG